VASVWHSTATRIWLQGIAESANSKTFFFLFLPHHYFPHLAAAELVPKRWKNEPGTMAWLKSIADDDTRADSSLAVLAAAPERLGSSQQLPLPRKHRPGPRPTLRSFVRSDVAGRVRANAMNEMAEYWKEDPQTLLLLNQRARCFVPGMVRVRGLGPLAETWKH